MDTRSTYKLIIHVGIQSFLSLRLVTIARWKIPCPIIYLLLKSYCISEWPMVSLLFYFYFYYTFCLHPFFKLNAFLISGIKAFLRALVRKYAEWKGSGGWIRLRVDRVGLALSVSTFTFQQTLRAGTCYEGFSPKVDILDVIIQLWKVEFAFTSQHMWHIPGRKRVLLWRLFILTPEIAKGDILWMLLFNFEKFSSLLYPCIWDICLRETVERGWCVSGHS